MNAAALVRIRRTSAMQLRDTGVRMIHTENVDADGQEVEATYIDGATLACRFSWGNDGTDRTRESAENVTSSDPHVHFLLGTVISSRDRFRLTHVYGQTVGLPLVFQVAGEPLPGVLTTAIELSRVAT